MTDRIHLSPPHLTGAEERFVADAFASNWIAPLGPHVDAFEAELAAAVGMPHAVALSSGTAALHPHFAIAAAAFAGATAFVPVARWLSLRLGVLDHPGGRKSHAQPVPCLGGLAVLAAVFGAVITGLLVGWISPAGSGGAFSATLWGLAAATVILATLGIVDDLLGMSARWKFAVEMVVAAAVALFLLDVKAIDFVWFQLSGPGGILAGALVVFWLVTVTNAFNMTDGHDGLAAGVGAMAAAAFGLIGWATGDVVTAAAAFALSGAFIGFLLFNAPPATIFLGDSGSLPLGFILACVAVLSLSDGGSWVVFPAVLVLGVPILDVTLAVTRRVLLPVRMIRERRFRERFVIRVEKPPELFTPDRGHLHHRLEAIGLSPWGVLCVVYFVAAIAAAGGLAATAFPELAPVVFGLLGAVATFTTVRRLYPELQVLRLGLLLPLFDLRMLRHRGLHAVFDFTVVLASFGFVHRILGDDASNVSTGSVPWADILTALTVVVVLLAGGVYRIHYRYIGLWDIGRTAFYVSLGLLGATAVVVLMHWNGLPAHGWLLAGYLTLTGVIGSRISFRVLDGWYRRNGNRGANTLIYGVGRGGHMVLRELLSNPDLQMNPVGFLDDDPILWGRQVEGYPVLNPGEGLKELLEGSRIAHLIVSTDKLGAERMAEVLAACEEAKVQLLMFRWTVTT
jgi:UDP-GlcNAc:undecaprenyl-phosphate GlcNAc-1-phosphate transferase